MNQLSFISNNFKLILKYTQTMLKTNVFGNCAIFMNYLYTSEYSITFMTDILFFYQDYPHESNLLIPLKRYLIHKRIV